MRHDPGDGEAVVCSLLGLYGYMLTDLRSTEPHGGKTMGIRAQGASIALEGSAGPGFVSEFLGSSVKSQHERGALCDSVVRRDCPMFEQGWEKQVRHSRAMRHKN